MSWQYADALQGRLSGTRLAWLAVGLVCVCVLGAGALWRTALAEVPLNEMIEEMNRTAPYAIMEGVRLDRLEWRHGELVAIETVTGRSPTEIERTYFEIQRLSGPAWCTGNGLLPRILRSAGTVGVYLHGEDGAVVTIGSMIFDNCDWLLHSPSTLD